MRFVLLHLAALCCVFLTVDGSVSTADDATTTPWARLWTQNTTYCNLAVTLDDGTDDFLCANDAANTVSRISGQTGNTTMTSVQFGVLHYPLYNGVGAIYIKEWDLFFSNGMAINATDGTMLWQNGYVHDHCHVPVQYGNHLHAWVKASMSTKTIVYQCYGKKGTSHLIGIDKDFGEHTWWWYYDQQTSMQILGESEGVIVVEWSPKLFHPELQAINVTNGKQIWNISTPSNTELIGAVDGVALVQPHLEVQGVVGYDIKKGNVLWNWTGNSLSQNTKILKLDGGNQSSVAVLALDASNMTFMNFLNVYNGSLIWSLPLNVDNTVYPIISYSETKGFLWVNSEFNGTCTQFFAVDISGPTPQLTSTSPCLYNSQYAFSSPNTAYLFRVAQPSGFGLCVPKAVHPSNQTGTMHLFGLLPYDDGETQMIVPPSGNIVFGFQNGGITANVLPQGPTKIHPSENEEC